MERPLTPKTPSIKHPRLEIPYLYKDSSAQWFLYMYICVCVCLSILLKKFKILILKDFID